MKQSYLEAVKTTMVNMGVSLEEFRTTKRMKPGFWDAVSEITGQTPGAAQTAGSRLKRDSFDELAALFAEDAKVDNGDKASGVDPNQEPATEKAPDSDPNVDKVDRADVAAMLADLEERLTELIDRRIDEALTSFEPRATTVDNVDMPPLPPKIGESGKKFAGDKADVRARIDTNLFDLLEDEAQTHFSGNMSRCLDAVFMAVLQPAETFL